MKMVMPVRLMDICLLVYKKFSDHYIKLDALAVAVTGLTTQSLRFVEVKGGRNAYGEAKVV